MGDDNFSNKDEAFQAFDDIPLSPPDDDTMGAVIARRYGRRDILKGSLAVTAATALFGTAALHERLRPRQGSRRRICLPRAGGRRRRDASRGRGLRRRHRDPLGRPARQGHEAVRSPHPDRRGAEQAVRLQQRLHRLLPARRRQHARAAVRQQRVRQPRGDVPRPRACGPIATTSPRSPRRTSAVEMAAHGVSIVEVALAGRQMGAGGRQQVQSPHHGGDADDASTAPPPDTTA